MKKKMPKTLRRMKCEIIGRNNSSQSDDDQTLSRY